ncbi:NUDIX domain-containing protein [Candidatus Parcubacteria bacterium]|nr:MAG: NUDIX domain-containing protein [Candidatus Parcubacteria bacterium]
MTTGQSQFEPKPGQTDYTNVRRAPTVNCVVKFGDKILIVKRSSTMRFYPGKWNGISGFLEDGKSIEDKAREEVREETGITDGEIVSLRRGESFEFEEPMYDKQWIVNPVLVEVKTDRVKIDWEAQEYRWIHPKEVSQFDTVPNFDRVVGMFFDVSKL